MLLTKDQKLLLEILEKFGCLREDQAEFLLLNGYSWAQPEKTYKILSLCLIIVDYRVKVLIPESEIWAEEEARPSHVLHSMIGATVDYAEQCERLIKERHRQYRAALNKFEEKKYDKAKTIFVSLGDYENSKQYADECERIREEQEEQYNIAIKQYDLQNYDEAINIFISISKYKNSKQLIEKCRQHQKTYSDALCRFNIKQYSYAKSKFSTLGNYKDSRQYIKKCDALIDQQYNAAVLEFNSMNFKEAKNIFVSLGNYKDAKHFANMCAYKIRFEEIKKRLQEEAKRKVEEERKLKEQRRSINRAFFHHHSR